MQHDEVIWQVLNRDFCSFKVKTRTATFCKHPQNVTGLCNRSSCPLANSRYATVMEQDGRCYLYSKSIERAHLPSALWEKRRLPANYAQALQVIDSELQYWPNFLLHKCKQRLTKIHQYLIRMRRIKLQATTKLVTVNRKVERREKVREAKAEKAARLSNAISAELIARLQAGTYEGSGMYVPNHVFQKALDTVGQQDDEGAIIGDDEQDDEADDSKQQEAADEGDDNAMRDEVEAENEQQQQQQQPEEQQDAQYEDEVEYVEDFEEDEDEDLEDLEDRLTETERDTEREADTDSGHQRQTAAFSGEDDTKDVEETAGTSRVTRSGSRRTTIPSSSSGSSSSSKPSTTPAKAGSHAGRKRGGVEIEYEEERVHTRSRH